MHEIKYLRLGNKFYSLKVNVLESVTKNLLKKKGMQIWNDAASEVLQLVLLTTNSLAHSSLSCSSFLCLEYKWAAPTSVGVKHHSCDRPSLKLAQVYSKVSMFREMALIVGPMSLLGAGNLLSSLHSLYSKLIFLL